MNPQTHFFTVFYMRTGEVARAFEVVDCKKCVISWREENKCGCFAQSFIWVIDKSKHRAYIEHNSSALCRAKELNNILKALMERVVFLSKVSESRGRWEPDTGRMKMKITPEPRTERAMLE